MEIGMKVPVAANDNHLPYPPPFQDLPTLAAHICAGESTIENWVKQGLFPQPRKVGGKRLWQWKEVERHLAQMTEASASSPDVEAQRIREATRAAATRSH
jgi:predicted DNA-binding transcriptional regulator AlpA